MREQELRSIVLVKSIEEADAEGTVLPVADRHSATREAKRNVGAALTAQDVRASDAGLGRRAERVLVARANTLLSQILPRHPFVQHALAGHPATVWLAAGLFVASVVFGAALAALDGTNRINILAFPFLGLLAWNFVVYVASVAGWVRGARSGKRRRVAPGVASRIALAVEKRAAGKSKSFVAPLGLALERFVEEWSRLAWPLTVARATRLFHLCAIGVAAGLVAGLYLRGLVLEYEAGWESTFLDAHTVRFLLSVLYGPASALTGIPIPAVEHLQTIRWQGAAGGERAAPWIHLIAACILLYIVLPRTLLAVVSTISVWRRSFRAPVPGWLPAYFRSVFGGHSDLNRVTVIAVPYAYVPAPGAQGQLSTLLRSALGSESAVDVREAIPYGDEQAFLKAFAFDQNGDGLFVLLFSLAATPEDENHGMLMSGLRDRLEQGAFRAPLLIVVDEGPYAARMAAQGGAGERMSERRRMWEAFARGRNVDVCFVDLARTRSAAGDAAADKDDVERLRAALHNAGGLST